MLKLFIFLKTFFIIESTFLTNSILAMFYVFLCILFTVYGQLVLKWRLTVIDSFPDLFHEKLIFTLYLFKDIYVISSFVAAFLGAISWMIALQKLELSFAYPFMSLSFIIVLVLSVFFLNESFNAYKLIGILLILLGTYVASKGL